MASASSRRVRSSASANLEWSPNAYSIFSRTSVPVGSRESGRSTRSQHFRRRAPHTCRYSMSFCGAFTPPPGLANHDWSGGDAPPIGGMSFTDIAECCRFCSLNVTDCSGFVTFSSTCYFKTGDLQPVSSQGRHLYSLLGPPAPPQLPPPPPASPPPVPFPPQFVSCAAFETFVGATAGDDLGVTVAQPISRCCESCRGRPSCIGFAYLSSDQTCYLKTGDRTVVNSTQSGLSLFLLAASPPPQPPG